MRMIILATLAALSASPSVGGPIMLWQTTRVGMTESEVRRAVPAAQSGTDLSPTRAGWVSLLDAHVREGSRDQKVSFQFKDGHLMGVTIAMGSPFKLEPVDGALAKAAYLSLHKTYGTPRRSFFTDDGFKAAQWIKDGKAIGYLEGPPPNISVLLFINREQPSDHDLFKHEKFAPIY